MLYLTAHDVTFSVEALPEYASLASDFDNPELVAEIRQAMARGNRWAWCCVKVTARWRGFQGVAYLGCCNYDSRAEFLASSDHAELRARAIDDLNATVHDTASELAPLSI